MTKFVHIRHYTWDGKVYAKGGHTIAYNFDPETRQAVYTEAKCNDRDHYNKKIGRAITGGRLAKHGGTQVQVPEDQRVADFIVRHLATTKYGYVPVPVLNLDALLTQDHPSDAAPSSTEPTVH